MSKRKIHKADATGRSKMDRFVRLDLWVLNSEAYRSLSGNATRVLIDMMSRYNGTNNGDIIFSVRMAYDIGIGKDNTARSLEELQAWGFIKITGESAFTLKSKTARTWALTTFPVGSTLPSKEFMSRRRDSIEVLTWINDQTEERISRSRRRDKLSRRRDRTPDSSNNISQTVAAARQKRTEADGLRSRRRDTSNLPCTLDETDDRELPAPQQKIGTKSILVLGDDLPSQSETTQLAENEPQIDLPTRSPSRLPTDPYQILVERIKSFWRVDEAQAGRFVVDHPDIYNLQQAGRLTDTALIEATKGLSNG